MAQLVPGQTTLGGIRLQALQRIEQVNNGSFPLDLINGYIGQSLYENYALLVQAFGESYKVAMPFYTFTTNSTQTNYPLPPDFWKIILMEANYQQSQQVYNITMERRSYQEKNNYSTPFTTIGPTGYIPYYCEFGDGVELFPTPLQAGLTINLHYIPRMMMPTETGSITFTGVVATNSITINGVTFTAVTSGATGTQFNIGGSPTDTASAAAFVTVFNGSSLAGNLTATSSGNVVTLTINNVLLPYAVAQTNYSPSFSAFPTDTWSNLVVGYNGWERLVVVDTCIQCLMQLQMDSAPFEREKQAMIKRIEDETVNRDAGSPKQTVRRRNARRGYGFGGC